MMRLVGDDYIGFGFDFDGIDKTPKGISGVQDTAKLINEIERHYGQSTAKKISEDNFLRVFKEIL